MKTKDMKAILLIALFFVCTTANGQIEKIWETNHTVGNDSLEVLFYKQDSSGNHYTGGAIGLTFFVSKFNSSGVHQWTVSDNGLIDKSPHFNYDTQPIAKNWVSDIVIDGTTLYLCGTKQYWNQWENGGTGGWNFILKLNADGDSIAFINVVKEDVPISSIWDETGHRPLLRMSGGQVYCFTSMFNDNSTSPGVRNINVFKYDDSLNLLKYRVFDGIISVGRDKIADVKIFDSGFFISSLHGAWQRNLSIDTTLTLKWQNVHYPALNTPKHSVLPSIAINSHIYTFANMRDTSRKDPQSGLGTKIVGHVRKYNVSGNLLDSLIVVKNLSSNDSLTDAASDVKGNIYTASISKDSGEYKVLISKINSQFEIEKQVLTGESPSADIQIEMQGCRLYVFFIDSLNTGTVLKLIRLDENLNILSEEQYHTGKAKIFSLTAKDKQLHLLSTGKNILTDTLSLKNLADTIVIAEPIVFTTLPKNPRSIELNWQLSGGLNDSVVIYKNTDNENWQLLVSLPSSLLTFTDSNLNPSTRYYYSIIVRWKEENSCNQLFVSDSTPFNTGINPVKNESFRIYPNPAYSEIQIEGAIDIEEIELLTLTGEVIRTYYQKENIAVGDLIPGFYFIRINRTYTHKIIKL